MLIPLSLFLLSIGCGLVIARRRGFQSNRLAVVVALAFVVSWTAVATGHIVQPLIETIVEMRDISWPLRWLESFWSLRVAELALLLSGPIGCALICGRHWKEKALLTALTTFGVISAYDVYYGQAVIEGPELGSWILSCLVFNAIGGVILGAAGGLGFSALERILRRPEPLTPPAYQSILNNIWNAALISVAFLVILVTLYMLFAHKPGRHLMLELEAAQRLFIQLPPPKWSQVFFTLEDGGQFGTLQWPATFSMRPFGDEPLVSGSVRVEARGVSNGSLGRVVFEDDLEEKGSIDIIVSLKDEEAVWRGAFALISAGVNSWRWLDFSDVRYIWVDYIEYESYNFTPRVRRTVTKRSTFDPPADLGLRTDGGVTLWLDHPSSFGRAGEGEEEPLFPGGRIDYLPLPPKEAMVETPSGTRRLPVGWLSTGAAMKFKPVNRNAMEVGGVVDIQGGVWRSVRAMSMVIEKAHGSLVYGPLSRKVAKGSVLSLDGDLLFQEREGAIVVTGEARSIFVNGSEMAPTMWSEIDDTLKAGFLAAISAILGWLFGKRSRSLIKS